MAIPQRIRNISPRRYAALIDRSRYRWRELWLLLLPASFMVLGVAELEIVNALKANSDQTQVAIPPLLAFLPAFGLIAGLFVVHLLLNIYAPDADQTILPIAGTLSTVGVLMALRLGPDLPIAHAELGTKQLVFLLIGLALCIGTVFATRDLAWIRNFKYTWAVVGIFLVGLTLVHARFNPNAPSRDQLSIGTGNISFQPSELLKICLVIFFAGYLSENREMLANAGYKLGPFTLPPFKHLGPLLVMLGISLLMFMYVRELGLALLIFGLILSMLYVASDRPSYVVTSLLLFGVGAFLAFKLYPYARVRLDLLGSAFNSQVEPNAGYQIVQGLIGFASGGVFGAGLGQGHPCYLNGTTVIPACNTDFVAAAFAEEFGFAGVLALIALFMLLVYRGMHIASRARSPFNQLMAVGLTSVFALQTLVILAGNLKIMPLTGIPLPFVAYGGSSLLANFIIIGLLLRLSMADA
jgi:cell division protein FtsW (lipid II flippase)